MTETTPPSPIKNLEGLRHVRGNDNAVVEIGSDADKKALLSVIQDPIHHSRDDLLRCVFANYSGEAYGDVQWPKKTGGWSIPEPTPYGTLRAAYPALAPLSLDLGFMTHLPDIMKQIQSGEVTTSDYLKTRNEIKEKLGNQIMYRGTTLTDDELVAVRQYGMVSPLAAYVAHSSNPQDEFEAQALSVYPTYSVDAHFHGENYFTPFLSLSSYEDVAIAVGRNFGKKEPGKKFYLFKLQIPTIDTISYSDNTIRMPSKLRELFERNPDYSIRVAIDGNEARHKWDDKVESFVHWKIDPGEIMEVSQPDVKESSWNGRKTSWT